MTRCVYTLMLDDGEAVSLQRALDLLEIECARLGDECPAYYDRESIKDIRSKLIAGRVPLSGPSTDDDLWMNAP